MSIGFASVNYGKEAQIESAIIACGAPSLPPSVLPLLPRGHLAASMTHDRTESAPGYIRHARSAAAHGRRSRSLLFSYAAAAIDSFSISSSLFLMGTLDNASVIIMSVARSVCMSSKQLAHLSPSQARAADSASGRRLTLFPRLFFTLRGPHRSGE